MEHTKNYHLPQWAEEDRILMADFNAMCAGLESGLTAAQAQADGAKVTADSGLSKAEAAQATADRNCMVKLWELAPGGEGEFTADLSGVDMGQYAALVVDASYWGSFTGATLYVNGDRGNHYYSGSDRASSYGISLGSGADGRSHATIRIQPCGESFISALLEQVEMNSYGVSSVTDAGGYTGCAWEGIQNLLFRVSAPGKASFRLYGLKA